MPARMLRTAFEMMSGCCPNVKITGLETVDEKPVLAAFVAVTVHDATPIEPRVEPITEQPTPDTVNVTAPVPKPPLVESAIELPAIPVKT